MFLTFDMKKLFLVACLFAISHTILAWGATGHRATGKVADKYLNKKARKAIEKILGGQSIAMSATWMDEIRSDSAYDYTSDWHWVTIQDHDTYDHSLKNPHGDLVQTLERVIAELKSHKLSAKEELERLKFLIHLVGDIHQPLHVGGGNDKGGNDVKVSWFRNDSNIHRVWDSDMIDDTKLSYTELAESLDVPSEAQILQWQKTTVRDWANESMTYRKAVYDIGKGKLGYEYAYKNFHIVRLRLLQSGIRIAGLLNEIYGK
jgi:hypothetical protein